MINMGCFEDIPRICFNSGIDQADMERTDTRVERSSIRGAFFGRTEPNVPIGLRISVQYDSDGTNDISYTIMKDIQEIFNNFRVSRPEQLIGERVYAHLAGTKLIALSKESLSPTATFRHHAGYSGSGAHC